MSAALSPCPMLLHLGRDIGAQFVLLRFFKLGDMAALAACCRTWAVWLNTDGATANKRRRAVKPSRLPQLLACPWVKRHIVRIDLSAEPELCHAREPAVLDMFRRSRNLRQKAEEHNTNAALHALSTLTEFPHLEHLQIEHSFPTPVSDAKLGDVFRFLAGSLTILALHNQQINVLQTFLHQVKHLKLLTNLSINGPRIRDSDRLQLDALPLLPHLATLIFVQKLEAGEGFFAPEHQIRMLSRCRSLTYLDWGDFSRHSGPLGIFAKSRLPNSSSASSAALAPLAPLRWLRLSRTVMSAENWEAVSGLTSLQSLWPSAWDDNLSEADWMRLGSFTQLQKLSIAAELTCSERTAPRDMTRLIPAIIRCTTITELHLANGMLLTREGLESIVTHLAALSFLSLKNMRVESVGPLSRAPCLTRLRLSYCTGAQDQSRQWRLNLPDLPLLEWLELMDTDMCILSSREAAGLNRALMLRLPKLTSARFVQNLSESQHILSSEV